MNIFTIKKPSVCSVLLASPLLVLSLLVLSLMVLSLPLMAMDLQQAMSNLSTAKSKGLVGEQADGYLGVVAPSPEAVETAKLINEARHVQYVNLAKDNNLALPDVEAMAGQKAIEKTQAGQYVQINKKWTKKP